MNRNVSIAELLKPQLPTSTKKGTVLNILNFRPSKNIFIKHKLVIRKNPKKKAIFIMDKWIAATS